MIHLIRPRLVAVVGTVLILATTITAQPMLTFPADTVIAEGCGDAWDLDTRLFGMNPTNEPFKLTWWKTQETYPSTGFSALIIDGRQYLPSANTGMVNLGEQDSVEVVFELYPNDMAPGDTMVYQVVVFNPEDSAGTAVLLTGMIVCPATTRVDGPMHAATFVPYPNPARGHLSFGIDPPLTAGHIDILTVAGQRIRSLSIAEAAAPFAVDDLPEGWYVACLVADNRILARTTLVITP